MKLWILFLGLLAGIVPALRADTTWVPAGDISGTWTAEDSPYLISGGNVTVAAGTALEIQPGVRVHFAGHYKLGVSGKLRALGTAADSIYFTTDLDINPAGWAGLRFLNAQDSCQLEYCVLENGIASGPTWSDSSGGLVHSAGSSKPRFAHCTFRNGLAHNVGGAVFVSLNARADLEDCLITGNSARSGGAVYLHRSDTVMVANCILRGNTASVNGGALYSYNARSRFTGSRFVANSTLVAGGAVAGNGSPSFYSCIFDSNYSNSDAGALYFTDSTSSIRVEDCQIIGNHGRVRAGGVYCWESRPYFRNCLIEGNWTGDRGGGVNVYRWGAAPVFDNCTIRGNRSSLHGGGVWCGTYSQSSFIGDTRISGNEADCGGGIYAINRAALTLDSCVIDSNEADTNGGGVMLTQFAEATLNRTTISANRAGEAGGGCCALSGFLTLKQSTVQQNQATDGGGIAILQTCGTTAGTLLKRSTITGNLAQQSGGGIFMNDGSCPELDHLFITNNAAADGGGVACVSDAAPTITRCTLVGNSAVRGGGLFSEHARPELNSSIVAFSAAGAGTYWISSANADARYCDFFGNPDGDFAGDGWPDGCGEINQSNAAGDSCDVHKNVFLDPQFVNRAADIYDLSATAPVIDVGDPDLPCDPDRTVADMGAAYYSHPQPMQDPHELVIQLQGNAVLLKWEMPLGCNTLYRVYGSSGGSYLLLGTTTTPSFSHPLTSGIGEFWQFYVVAQLDDE